MPTSNKWGQDHVHVLEYIEEDVKGLDAKPIGKYCPECQLITTMNGTYSRPKVWTGSRFRDNKLHRRRLLALGLTS